MATIIEEDDVKMGCTHPDHNPPMHIALRPGQKMTHTCDGCGAVSVLRNPMSRQTDGGPYTSKGPSPHVYMGGS